MSRPKLFLLWAIPSLVMLVCGLLVPMHLRAVDSGVIRRAGKGTPTLSDQGLVLVGEKKLGAAQLALEAARQEMLPDRENLRYAVTNLAAQNPGWMAWGGGDPRLEGFFENGRDVPKSGWEPLTDFIIRGENRGRALELLRHSSRPVAQELVRCQALTNLVIFPPSQSASGQAFDAAISICGLLSEEDHLAPGMSNAVLILAGEANHGGTSEGLEQVLMDFLSLAERFNWGQLEALVSQIGDIDTLRLLAEEARHADEKLPALFSAVVISGQPGAVTKYLADFSQTGLEDLSAGLRSGVGGAIELLRRDQRLYRSNLHPRVAGVPLLSSFSDVATDYSLRAPWIALTVKWLFYLLGGFLAAAGVHSGLRAGASRKRPLEARGLHVARELLFALGFLLLVLLLSEPYLAQESQKVDFPFRLRLPAAGSAVPVPNDVAHVTIMNQLSLLTLLLFFVLQGLIYTACIVKLAEIRRQNLAARMKLKLLENEDHLFDAGLYLGFAGTIISLILVSLGVIQFSLMAAYSSTSFGIIFVSFFKIFHLRPARRKLLLEADALPDVSSIPSGLRTFSQPS